MPAPRLPLAKARVLGADRKNPARFRDRAAPAVRPLGAPSAWLSGLQVEAWEAFRREIPWLAESDRSLLEVAAVVRARLMAGEEVGVQALNLLRQCVEQMGGIPADRSKAPAPADEGGEPDPAAKYFS